MIGGFRDSFQTASWWPVYCDACDDITQTNVCSQPLFCRNCNSTSVTKYDAKNLVDGGTRTIISFGEDEITNEKYFCPKCKNQALKFKEHPDIYYD